MLNGPLTSSMPNVCTITSIIMIATIYNKMYGSRKYPYPHHRGNWKFQRDGGSKAQEIPKGRRGSGGGGGGLTVKLTSRWFNSILYQHSCYKIATYQLWWNVLKFEGERGGYCFLEKMENPGRWRGGG